MGAEIEVFRLVSASLKEKFLQVYPEVSLEHIISQVRFLFNVCLSISIDAFSVENY